MIDLFLTLVVLQTSPSSNGSDSSDKIKIVQLPETPPDANPEPSITVDGPEPAPARQPRYPVPGRFQLELTYVVDKPAFERFKTALLPLGEEAVGKLDEAYSRYRTTLGDLDTRMASVCGSPPLHPEKVDPADKEANAEAQLKFAQAKARAGLEADRRMTGAFDALEREMIALATTDSARNALDQAILRWKREALLDYYFYPRSNWQDFNEEIDLTNVARSLAQTAKELEVWLSVSTDSGARPADSDNATVREAQDAINVAMQTYAVELKALLQKRWAARAAWRDAGVAICKGSEAERDEELRKSETRWLELHQLTERTRDRVAEAIERAADASGAAAWRKGVNEALCPALFGRDTLDYAFRWLTERASLPEPIRQEIQASYAVAVKERDAIRKALMRAMVDVVQKGVKGHREVGFFRRNIMLPEFEALMFKRHQLGEATLAEWRQKLDKAKGLEFDAVVRQIRERGMQTDTLEF